MLGYRCTADRPKRQILCEGVCGRDVLELPVNVYGVQWRLVTSREGTQGIACMLHAYRLVYPGSPHAPEMLWEWDKAHLAHLLWNATTFARELAHRYFPTWDALAEENQRLWEIDYLPRPAYQPWDTWQAWLDAYRDLVHDVQDIYEKHHGRRSHDPIQARQRGEEP